MINKTLNSGDLVGVNRNASYDAILLNVGEGSENGAWSRIKLTPQEAYSLAQKLIAEANAISIGNDIRG